MPLFVRKLGSRTQWDDPTPAEAGWLGARDLRADALGEIETDENTLSIYEIKEESGISTPRILAALAAGCNNRGKADFVVFDSAILDELEIVQQRIKGETFDKGVNDCHINLVQLTAERLARFGAKIRSDGDRQRYTWKDVRRHLRDSIGHGHIDPIRIAPGLRKDL